MSRPVLSTSVKGHKYPSTILFTMSQFGVTLTNRRGQNCNLTNLIPSSSSSILIVFFLPIQLYRGGIPYLLSHLSFLSLLLVNSSDQTSFNCFIYKLSLTLTDPSVSIRSPTFFENSSRSISYNILHRFLQKIISQKLDSGIFDNRLRSDKTNLRQPEGLKSFDRRLKASDHRSLFLKVDNFCLETDFRF